MEFLKIAVLNNSGNVGKSTICNHFLHPRIPDADVIRIETINHGGEDGTKISSKDMTSVIEKVDLLDLAIIDIGSSNIENFIKGMKENSGTHEDIDIYLLPVTPDTKQQKDTCNTVDELVDMGVEPSSIFILLNRVDTSISLESQFSLLVETEILKLTATSSLAKCCVIPNTEIFTLIDQIGTTYHDAVHDDTNYRDEIRATKDRELRSILSLKKSCHRLVLRFDEILSVEFSKLKKQFNQ